ncbi:hypothetical protein GAY31_19555 [Azospirillum brasilense]|nr:hypothetical protein [Azospirillum brasilense]
MITQHHQDRLVAQGRDEMMTAFCKVARPNEAQQREASERFTALMQELVPQIVGVVAVGDYPSTAVELVDYTGKGKIMLKGKDAEEVGDMLCGKVGCSLTLVLTDAAQFDRKRPAATIDPDQKALPMEPVDGGEDDDEDGTGAEDDEPAILDDSAPAAGGVDIDLQVEPDQPAEQVGPFFSAVEVGTAKDGTGAEVSLWVLLHGDEEVFEAIAAPEHVQMLADALNNRASALGRNLTPFEIRDAVIGMSTHEVAPLPKGPYTTEAIQNSAAPAVEEKSRRGRLSDVRKVELYHLGYDAAEAGRSVSEAGEGYTDGETKHIQRGWADQKDSKPRAWTRPGGTPKAANDDSATGADSEAA